MSTETSIIRLSTLRQARVNQTPFPFVVIPDFLSPEFADELVSDFPNITRHGSFPLSEVQYGEAFRQLTEELSGSSLRSAIASKFEVDLDDRFTMITVRGIAGKRDGRIHADTKSKFLTLLLYLNQSWDHPGGRLRILNSSGNLNDYIMEIPPVFGTCLIFKVTPNCWHGHTPFVGPRRVLQLNYIRDEAARDRHILRHKFTAKIKNLHHRITYR